MSTTLQIHKEMRRLKAEALKRRLRELGLADADIMTRLRLRGRDALSKWKAGTSWPKLGETLLAKAIETPDDFFERIANGESYEKAILPPDEEEIEGLALGQAMEDLIVFHHLRRENKKAWFHIKSQLSLFREQFNKEYPELRKGKPMSPELYDKVRQIAKLLEEEIRTGEYPDEPQLKKMVKK